MQKRIQWQIALGIAVFIGIALLPEQRSMALATIAASAAARATAFAPSVANTFPAVVAVPSPGVFKCPVTRPIAVPDNQIPHDGWADPIHSPAWYRSADGKILADASFGLQSGSNKFGWLRPSGAKLTITGQRLDSPAPPLKVWVPDGYPGYFQVSDLDFPTAGCWEITAQTSESTLRFVTQVKGP